MGGAHSPGGAVYCKRREHGEKTVKLNISSDKGSHDFIMSGSIPFSLIDIGCFHLSNGSFVFLSTKTI